MKIIVSSKHLADQLNKLDLDNSSMFRISTSEAGLIINTVKDSIIVGCNIQCSSDGMIQKTEYWQRVKSLVSVVEEQPIVLEVNETRINVIFSY